MANKTLGTPVEISKQGSAFNVSIDGKIAKKVGIGASIARMLESVGRRDLAGLSKVVARRVLRGLTKQTPTFKGKIRDIVLIAEDDNLFMQHLTFLPLRFEPEEVNKAFLTMDVSLGITKLTGTGKIQLGFRGKGRRYTFRVSPLPNHSWGGRAIYLTRKQVTKIERDARHPGNFKLTIKSHP